jgi:putative membrane protein insertion efficiency factor
VKALWQRTIGAALVAALTGAIRVYQLTLSKLIGPVCKYHPSCSHYGYEAITVHGAGKGLLLTGWRLLRCNPWSRGGFDPVPPRGQWQQIVQDSTTRQVPAA